MKNRMIVGAFSAALILTACNNLFKSSETEQIKFTTHREAFDTLRKKHIATLDTFEVRAQKTDSIVYRAGSNVVFSADSAKKFLSKVNFASLLGSSHDQSDYVRVYNGFFGDDRYRIEFYFAGAEQDPDNPARISIHGKSRFKKNIVPFTGTIFIDSVTEFFDPRVAVYWEDYAKGKLTSYHLAGSFTMNEQEGSWGTGKFNGRFNMDFRIDENGESQMWFFYPDEYEGPGEDSKAKYDSLINTYVDVTKATRGAGFLFDGNWTSNKTLEVKPLLLACDIFMFGNDILEHFSYGEREIQIDPKYKVLGWDNYWENDEWYNDENATVMMITW